MDRHTGSPVRQTMVDTVTRELLRGRGAENEVALEARVDDLHNHLLVGEADNQAVLGGVAVNAFRTLVGRKFHLLLRTTCSSPGRSTACGRSLWKSIVNVTVRMYDHGARTYNQSCPPSGDGT